MKLIKISLAMLSLPAAMNAFAALPGTTDPTAVNMAVSSPKLITLGVTGFYLKPSDTNSDTAYASVAITPTNTNANATLFSPETNYDWGYGVNLGYQFANSPYDINVSYYNYDSGKYQSSVVEPQSVNQAEDIGPDSDIVGVVAYDAATESSEYTINQVDLTLGKYVNYGCRVRLHPNVGLRYAKVDRELNSLYVLNPSTRSFFGTTTYKEDSDFSGLGPVFGLDGSFYIGAGFGAVAHADYSLLLGTVDATVNELDELSVISQGTTAFPVNFNNEDNDRIVQVTDLKLGGDYTYLFNQNNPANLTLEIGYQYSAYINPIDRLEAQSKTDLKDSDLLGITTSNLGLHGPYASLILHV